MSGYCAICTKKGPIGWVNPHVPDDMKRHVWFCSIQHERMWKKMNTTELNHCEIAAIEKILPAIGQSMANRGTSEKRFVDMTKPEVCGLIADIVRNFRRQLDIENETDIPF